MTSEVKEVVVGFLDSELVFQRHKKVAKGDNITEMKRELSDELEMLGTQVFSILVVFRFVDGSTNTFSDQSWDDMLREAEAFAAGGH